MLLNATARVSHFLIALNRNFKSFINTTHHLRFLIDTKWSQRTYQVAFDIYSKLGMVYCLIKDFFLKFEAEGREFAEILRSLEEFYTKSTIFETE